MTNLDLKLSRQLWTSQLPRACLVFLFLSPLPHPRSRCRRVMSQSSSLRFLASFLVLFSIILNVSKHNRGRLTTYDIFKSFFMDAGVSSVFLHELLSDKEFRVIFSKDSRHVRVQLHVPQNTIGMLPLSARIERYCCRCRISYPVFYSKRENTRILVFANLQKHVLICVWDNQKCKTVKLLLEFR